MNKKSPLATWKCSLLSGLALTLSLPALAAETPPPKEALEQLDEVVIYGTSGELIMGLHAESELGEEAIAAYGANTVGDLLAQISPDVDNTEQGPLILINGKPAVGIRSVNDLPPESIKSVQVLPPGAAAALGESPTRRVINVVLKAQFHQGTANLTARAATAGQGTGANGDYNLTQLVDNHLRQIAAYIRKTDPLLEADRDIQSQTTFVPYDLAGNVVSWPVSGGEIDPGLSAAAGTAVTVAGVPMGNATPQLADFLPYADTANLSDMGRYRTLVGNQVSYGLNGNLSRPLPHNTSLSINANLDRSTSRSLTGATATVLHVPASSPYSPFDSDVGIARYLGEPLQQKSESTTAYVGANLNTQLGKWRLLSEASLNWRRSITDSERRVDTTALQSGIDAGTVNPFDPLADDLLGDMFSDHARASGYTTYARLQLSGAVFALPAGKATLNLSGQWQHAEQNSTTTGTNNFSRSTRQDTESAYLNLQLPLLGTPQSQGFGMGGELNGAAREVTGTGSLYTYSVGLNARNGTLVNMRIGYSKEKQAPTTSALSDPLVIIDGYRTYDFLREETVLVRYITGGNPDLLVENRDIINVSGQTRPFKTVDFTLNAQYTHSLYHDPMQSLPPPSAPVEAAFPDRFMRDADGQLYQIDARTVNFVRTTNETFRWGGNFRRSFGVPKGAAPQTGNVVIVSGNVPSSLAFDVGADNLTGAGWRLNANFTHQWQIAYKRLMREGQPEVDLLAGGAGFGTAQPRHRVQGTFGLAHNGTGLQLNGNWTNDSHLDSGTPTAPNRLDFSPTLRFDLQAFSNIGTMFPDRKLLKGVRISLNVDNLLDSRQRVRDQQGVTPLRYQPYLLSPLGRVVSLSFRKAFS